jgi:aquaporin Z
LVGFTAFFGTVRFYPETGRIHQPIAYSVSGRLLLESIVVMKPTLFQRLSAEAAGTFMVTVVAIGVDVLYFTGRPVDDVSRWLARGFIAAAAIFSFSALSGAHLNPAVTFGFALRGVFPWPRAAAYVFAQFVGAFVATALAFALYGAQLKLGASHPGPGFSSGVAAACECVLTAMVMLVILATAREEAVVGKDAALAVGFAIAACGFCAGAISGASTNPARTIAPQLIAGQFSLVWIYIAGPLAGAALGVAAHWLTFGAPRKSERKSARGAS